MPSSLKSLGDGVMHQISQQTAQAAQKHALQSIEDGKSVEEVGRRLRSQ